MQVEKDNSFDLVRLSKALNGVNNFSAISREKRCVFPVPPLFWR